MKAKCIALISLLFFLVACDANNIYREYSDIKQFNWSKDQVMTFKVDIADNSMPYNVQVGFRHMAQIQKMVINTAVKMTSPSGNVTENTYQIIIRDTQGLPLGETMGNITDIEVPVEEPFTFAETGTYTFEVSHLEKEDVVAGMMEVGVVIDKAGN